MAERDGMSKDSSRPVPSEIAISSARSANIPRVIWTSFSRLTRSAIAPPQTAKTSTGPRVAVLTIPTIRGESVNECISQKRP